MEFSAIPMRETSHRGVRIHVFQRQPETGRTVALIAMDPGCGYPSHRHQGTEDVYVLQGGYADELGDYGPGQLVRYAPGTEHGPRASGSPGGEPCVLLALAHEGVKLLA